MTVKSPRLMLPAGSSRLRHWEYVGDFHRFRLQATADLYLHRPEILHLVGPNPSVQLETLRP
jgi:hypothetical protein